MQGREVRLPVRTPDEIEYAPPLRHLVFSQAKRAEQHFAEPFVHPGRAVFEAGLRFDDAMHRYAIESTLKCSLSRHQGLGDGAGLSVCAPFTHPTIVAFSARLPRAMRLTDRSRPLLKALCDRLVHPNVASWPKLGFPVPWRAWVDRELRELLGTPRDYAVLQKGLPAGFVDAAFAINDHEALWTLMNLRVLVERFDVDCTAFA